MKIQQHPQYFDATLPLGTDEHGNPNGVSPLKQWAER